MQLIIFFSILISSAFADVSTCRVDDLDASDCAFYNDCIESKVQCGKSGYALSYGEHYCNRFEQKFTDYAEEFSSMAHVWRERTAVCLQKEILSTVEEIIKNPTASNQNDCRTIRVNAFSQHAECYTQEESSICLLPPRDIISILRLRIIDYRDLFFTREARSQIREVQKICLRQLSRIPKDSRYKWWKENALNVTNYL